VARIGPLFSRSRSFFADNRDQPATKSLQYIVKQLGTFPNAVLTGIDSAGYPYSIRCKPHVDESRKGLLITQSGDVPIQPGPACILCHFHNEGMWNLRSFEILGNLEKAEQAWFFHVERSIPESSPGPFDQFQMIYKARVDAKKYLEKRGLPRPKVDWNGIKKLRVEARKSGK
jgi:hypothetical protein